jgi:hypothetical protein
MQDTDDPNRPTGGLIDDLITGIGLYGPETNRGICQFLTYSADQWRFSDKLAVAKN